jgi:hypothetical protein
MFISDITRTLCGDRGLMLLGCPEMHLAIPLSMSIPCVWLVFFGRHGLNSLDSLDSLNSLNIRSAERTHSSIILDARQNGGTKRRPCISAGWKLRSKLPTSSSHDCASSASEMGIFLSFIPVRVWLKHAIASRLTIEASLWYHCT